jgi:flavodoxin
LPETINLPEGAVVYVDDVCIPYSWYTIADNFTDKTYVWVGDVIAHTFAYYIFKIEQGVYSGYTLTDKIALAFQAITQANFTVTYYNTRNEIQVTCNYANVNFKILTPTDLATKLNGAWLGVAYDVSNPYDMNEVLRNMGGASKTYYKSYQNNYVSGYLGLHQFRTIYIFNVVASTLDICKKTP